VRQRTEEEEDADQKTTIISATSSADDTSYLQAQKPQLEHKSDMQAISNAAQLQVEKLKEETELRAIPDLKANRFSFASSVSEHAEKWALDIDTDKIVSVMFKCFWYLSKNNFVPKAEIENDLQKYGETQALKDAPPHISSNNKVPPFVRYTYCRAQKDYSPDECKSLATSENPIYGDAETKKLYERYVANQKQIYEEQQEIMRVEQISQLKSEQQIREKIMAAITEAREGDNEPELEPLPAGFGKQTTKPLSELPPQKPATMGPPSTKPSSISTTLVEKPLISTSAKPAARLSPPTVIRKPPPAVIRKPPAVPPPAVIRKPESPAVPPPAVIRKPEPPAVPTPTIVEPPPPIITTPARKPPPAVIRKPPPNKT
jgi:hypothetical protein